MVAVGRIADTIPMTYARSQIAPPGARETGQPAFAALRCMATYASMRILLNSNVANAG